jgi:enoyl-CoA hydratase
MSSDSEILCDRAGPLGILTLNREKALNALTLGMIRAITAQLDAWRADPGISAVFIRGAGGRAFCAGGDIKAAHMAGRAFQRGETQERGATVYFGEEYNFNCMLFHYPKPLIAFMDGIVMGGGYGIAGPCRYRIATPKTLFAMPETGIGFFPDVGATYFLTRAPGQAGAYLAVSGAHVGPADALLCGAASHYVAGMDAQALIRAFSEAPPEDVLARYAGARPEAPSVLAAQAAVIDSCFGAETIEAILQNLAQNGSPWALETARLIETRSPTSLKVTLARYLRAKGQDFDAVAAEDFTLAQHFMEGHDFYEGVRAMVIDKDRRPEWSPARLGDVTEADIARYFAPAPRRLSELAA